MDMASSVDVSGAIRFDLGSGAGRLAGGEAGVVVPAAVLGELVTAASADARKAIGRKLGEHLGKNVARRAGGAKALLDGGLEATASLLAAELALSGLGSCNLERWGRALVVHVAGAPTLGADFVASIIEGALAQGTGKSLEATVLSDGSDGVRVVITSQSAAGRIRGWLGDGVAWADALGRLQTPGGRS